MLNFEEFTVSMFLMIFIEDLSQEIMDAIKAAGGMSFKPVKGQPIAEQDMKRVFKLVDMDKSGAISQLV